MKRIYTLLLVFALSPLLIAQEPCGWFPGPPTPDQATIDTGLVIDTIYKVPASYASPTFSGDGIAEIDNVWYAANAVPIDRHVAGSTPDPNIYGEARFMYDDNWMYILVVVSGDLEIDMAGPAFEQDRVSLYFQNTWGGKGIQADHCNEADWANYYWEQDGDRKWVMPVNRATTVLNWLDQDLDDNCLVRPSNCGEIDGDDWLTLEATQQLKYNVYTSNDTIIYEVALHLKNWLKYSYADVSELGGHTFGFDISILDWDGVSGNTDQVNLNDPGNNAWAWAKALGKFTFNNYRFLPCVKYGTPYDIACSTPEISKSNDLSIFPNPVQNILTIESLFGISNISIVSITGQKLLVIDQINSDKIEIDLSSLENGLYFLNVQMDDKRGICKKVVKE